MGWLILNLAHFFSCSIHTMEVPSVALCAFKMCQEVALCTFKILQELLYLCHEGGFKIDVLVQELVLKRAAFLAFMIRVVSVTF